MSEANILVEEHLFTSRIVFRFSFLGFSVDFLRDESALATDMKNYFPFSFMDLFAEVASK
jgi:hypothetical protein